MTCDDTRLDQIGFDDILAEAEAKQADKEFERRTGHMPDSMAEGVPFYRDLIQRHHDAMLIADVDAVMSLREEACDLAVRLNSGDGGILAGADAPGCVLARETVKEPVNVPLWGQEGEFTIVAAGMEVRIEFQGLFGTGASVLYWPGFAARAVDISKPFLSETGYRSFTGVHADPVPGIQPDDFCRRMIETYIEDTLKGRLLAVKERGG